MHFHKYIWIFFIAIIAQAQTKYDPTFSIGTGFAGGTSTSKVQVITVQSNKRVLIGGAFTTYNGQAANKIVRVMPHGAIDESFTTGEGFNNDVFAITVQNDEKIIVGGLFTQYNGTTANRIIRLNKDGSIDPSFNVGIGFGSGSVEKILIDTDGKILVAGSFINFNGNQVKSIVRLQANGALDNTFNVGGIGADSYIMDMELQSDGKIVIGGAFSKYNNVVQNKIARLNADGTLDTTFNTGTNPGITAGGNVMDIGIQSTAKIVVGGFFTEVQGNAVNYIARLNPNGSFDATFGYSGTNQGVVSLEIVTGNKILIGGGFTSYDDNPQNRFAYLDVNGSIVGSLDGGNFGSGFDGYVNNIAFDNITNNVYVAGNFYSFDGNTTIKQLARIHTLETIDIPDPQFEQYLINAGVDTNGVSGNVLFADIHNVTNLVLFGNTYNINDLSGIEGFGNLLNFGCYTLPLVIYDFSYNSKLTQLSVSNCNLSSIDISNQTNLYWLNLQNNNLQQLDLTNNIDLQELYVDHNELTSIDLSSLLFLENVGMGANFFTTLDFTYNPYLNAINSYDNLFLTSLDLRNGHTDSIESLNTAGCESLHCVFVGNAAMTIPTEWVLTPTATLVETEAACASLSTNEWEKNFHISFYPNPSSEFIYIEAKDVEIKKLSIYDQLGKTVIEDAINTGTVNISRLNNGIYLLIIQSDKGLVSMKFVKK